MNRILRTLCCKPYLLTAVIILTVGFGSTSRAETDASLRTEKHARKIEKKLTKYRAGSIVQVNFRDDSVALGSLGDVLRRDLPDHQL